MQIPFHLLGKGFYLRELHDVPDELAAGFLDLLMQFF